MPGECGNSYKKLCGTSMSQLYVILELCAHMQYIFGQENLDEASRSIAEYPKNESSSGSCTRHINTHSCFYRDEYCFSATYTNTLPISEDYDEIAYEKEGDDRLIFTIKCTEHPVNIDQLFDSLPRLDKSNYVELYLKNLFKIPVKFFEGKILYSAKLKYTNNSYKIVNVLNRFKHLRRLDVQIKSYVPDEEWLVALLRSQTALRFLSLNLMGRNYAHVIFPMESFDLLDELLKLSIWTKSLHNLTREHFRNLTKLESLDLKFGKMQTLEPTLFSALHELRSLQLSFNELRYLPPQLFAMQRKLISLDLGHNQLEYLPTHLFEHTPRLSELVLQLNNFKSIANILAALNPLNYLNSLNLRYNKFESITHANETLLTRINPKTYDNVLYATPKLDLSDNNLINFTWDGKAACNLEIVLSNNRISNIQALTLPTAVTPTCTRFLDLSKNPLHCDCQLVWFYYLYFLPASTIRTDTTTWVCDSPWKFAGRFLRTLQLEDVCERSATFCPAMCNCTRAYGEDGSSALVINCTGVYIDTAITQLPHSHKVAVAQTTLYIERCKLTELPLNLINSYANVTRLYAAENNITTLTASHLPSTLLLLDLRANNLKRLSGDFLNFLNQSKHLQALHLSHNPWLCDCEVMQLVYTLRTQRALISDIDRLACADGSSVALLRVDPSDICRTSGTIVLVVLALSLFAVMPLILTALYYKYRIEVKVWLYAHKLCVFWISEEELDQNKPFDAFISYSHQQSQYISEVLLPGLEQGQPPFRICVHDRNWLAGACIPDQIVRSVEQSRRTIFVLSKDFIESNWARLEFHTAHQRALNEGRTRIIVIKYDDLANVELLDKELQAYLKTNTYLEPKDPRFWPKLRYAMPHKKNMGSGHSKFYIPEEMELDN